MWDYQKKLNVWQTFLMTGTNCWNNAEFLLKENIKAHQSFLVNIDFKIKRRSFYSPPNGINDIINHETSDDSKYAINVKMLKIHLKEELDWIDWCNFWNDKFLMERQNNWFRSQEFFFGTNQNCSIKISIFIFSYIALRE